MITDYRRFILAVLLGTIPLLHRFYVPGKAPSFFVDGVVVAQLCVRARGTVEAGLAPAAARALAFFLHPIHVLLALLFAGLENAFFTGHR